MARFARPAGRSFSVSDSRFSRSIHDGAAAAPPGRVAFAEGETLSSADALENALQRSAAFPVEDVPIAKRRHFEISEIVRTQVFNEGTVWNDDDVFFSEPLGVIQHFSIVIEHQPFVRVRTREGFVETAAVLSNGDAEGAEAFLSRPVKNL